MNPLLDQTFADETVESPTRGNRVLFLPSSSQDALEVIRKTIRGKVEVGTSSL